MNDEKAIRALSEIRETKFRIWEDYHNRTNDRTNELERNYDRYWCSFYDERIRALDWIIAKLHKGEDVNDFV